MVSKIIARENPSRPLSIMLYRPLGKTGIQVSAVSFGAGPVAELMTDASRFEDQCQTVQRGMQLGINWIDTAATYGDGRSEESLGRVLQALDLRTKMHVATKVRIPPEAVGDIPGYIHKSVDASLSRLRLPKVTLLQLHNSITAERGAQPTSLTPEDVLGRGGVLTAMKELKSAGAVEHLGLTGLGEPAALVEVLQSRQFETIQTPYNLLNPSSGRDMPAEFAETNLGNLIATCREFSIGVFAIRVFAGGALAGQEPSKHTLTTKFFPLDLFRRDEARAAEIATRLSAKMSLREVALRFAISHPDVASAIVGFGSPTEVDEAARHIDKGPLTEAESSPLTP